MNPLTADHPLSPLPAFDRIQPEHAEPALDAVLAQNRRELEILLSAAGPAGWSQLIEPLEEMGDRVSRAWGPVQHLFGVNSTPEWRKAFNAGLPKITEYGLELSQSEPLYRAYKALSESAEHAGHSGARKKVVSDALRDFKLSGIALPEKEKARYKDISLRLSELQSRFEENLMDSIQAWSRTITDESLLDGMTPEGKAAARAKAEAKGEAKGEAGWRLTLDFPSYDAVTTYAHNRALRRELYEAYATRASEKGPHKAEHDNTPLMQEILALRHEQAQLLGYKNFAELSLATKMADSPDEVETFLLDLARRARARALAEFDELKKFSGLDDFAPWDSAYYAEKLKEQKLGLSDEELKPYFPAERVIQGMFDLVQSLYGIRIEKVSGIPAWHADVTTYELKDAAGKAFGLFYLDPYAREHKRSGAWMDECVSRRRTARGVQKPVAYLTCNFTPPLPGQPALLTHEEVVTLFHEFGHGLHHLLTQVDEGSVAGIRGVAWDAVELPSQFMENWCYDPATLRRLARHHKTGAPLPEEMIAKLRASRSWLSGLATLRQIEFALFDLRLHRDDHGAGRILETLQQARDEVAVVQPPEWNRMPNSFGHVFAGGYAAGYYSYKWAEVLSADAFAAFEESQFAAETGARFRDTILAQGGSKEAMDLFVEFRGRKPSIEALLRHTGLAQAA